MEFFVTTETTEDHSELGALWTFQARLNAAGGGLQPKAVDWCGLVFVIMDPEIAPPFSPGAIFRRSKRMLDLKPQIDFELWRVATQEQRISLMAEAALALIEAKMTLPTEDRDLIRGVLLASVLN